MGVPCGKCGSTATYVNEVWTPAGRGNELSCIMCGWRSAGPNKPKVIEMTQSKNVKGTAVKHGRCRNCGRTMKIIASGLCHTCYSRRDDRSALQRLAGKFRDPSLPENQPHPENAIQEDPAPERCPVLEIRFDGPDDGLFRDFLELARFNRRTPENHILYLIQRDVHEERALRREEIDAGGGDLRNRGFLPGGSSFRVVPDEGRG